MTAATAMMAAALAAAAVPAPDYENPAANSRNRMPAATYAMPLADVSAAFGDALEPETPWTASLDGDWKFKWTGDPARRPAGFWKPDFDVSRWETIDVPSCVELRGYGMPHYMAHGYPHKFKWPKILDRETGRPDYNPVMSYRRTFTPPDAWKGRSTILRFEGVASAFTVWINGKKAGYAEDSRLPSEFDITTLLVPGENTIAVEVFRWCDGSYLEDQDMFRFSGIYRNVSLWSRPAAGGIADFIATPRFADSGRKNAILDVAVKTYGLADAPSVALYLPDGTQVARASGTSVSLPVREVRAWSAEDPFLYVLVVKSGPDIRSKRVGFKEQKIEGGKFLVNGRPVKLRGVNRHECSAENGYSVTVEEMLRDATMMKRANIDTVRTCHYPDHRLWYDICDRYGIYLVAEANVEAHGAGYGKDGLGPVKAWAPAIVERNVRQVAFYRNNPSIVVWSMGNETKHGICFRKAIEAVKRLDSSRPVHWECGNADADFNSKMYPSVEWVEKRGAEGDAPGGRPLFLCEYAHAMGNAVGNLKEYWDVIWAHPSLMGGCIWDWADQAIWKETDRADPATGRRERYLAYGGDFDECFHDGTLCMNGIVDALRSEGSPKLAEVAHVYRSLFTTRRDDGSFEVRNGFGFTPASAFDGTWTLLADGEPVASGSVETDAAPLSTAPAVPKGLLEEALEAREPEKEYFVNFAFATKTASPWAPKGYVIARDQLAIPPALPAAERFVAARKKSAERAAAAAAATGQNAAASAAEPLAVVEQGGILRVSRAGTVATFDRKSGTISRLVLANGAVVFDSPAPGLPGGPRLACARAFVDNDKWLKKSFMESGLMRLSRHAEPLDVDGETVRAIVDVAGAKGCGFRHEAAFLFLPDGAVEIESKVVPYGIMPVALPRLGLTALLHPSLENMRWYGRGPLENYIDRNSASFFGIWNSTVTEQYVDYVKPQDCGCKTDVRWAEFTDASGRGARFSADVPLAVRALHYGEEDLRLARHERRETQHRTPLAPRRETILDLDVRQTGLGGSSVGPAPLPQYRFDPSATVSWTIRIEPAGGAPSPAAAR